MSESLENRAARYAACLWDLHNVCPECGDQPPSHMSSCKQTYERAFTGPQDYLTAFRAAFPSQDDEHPPEEQNGGVDKALLKSLCQHLDQGMTIEPGSLYHDMIRPCAEEQNAAAGGSATVREQSQGPVSPPSAAPAGREVVSAEAAAYKWAYGYLQDRMESLGRHSWAHDCDGEIEARILAAPQAASEQQFDPEDVAKIAAGRGLKAAPEGQETGMDGRAMPAAPWPDKTVYGPNRTVEGHFYTGTRLHEYGQACYDAALRSKGGRRE